MSGIFCQFYRPNKNIINLATSGRTMFFEFASEDSVRDIVRKTRRKKNKQVMYLDIS